MYYLILGYLKKNGSPQIPPKLPLRREISSHVSEIFATRPSRWDPGNGQAVTRRPCLGQTDRWGEREEVLAGRRTSILHPLRSVNGAAPLTLRGGPPKW